MQNDFPRAVRLYAAAEALQETLGMSLLFPDYQRSNHEQTIAMLRTNLDEATFIKTWSEGRAMTMEQAIAYGVDSAY
jgi:hypothetical protein